MYVHDLDANSGKYLSLKFTKHKRNFCPGINALRNHTTTAKGICGIKHIILLPFQMHPEVGQDTGTQ